MYANETAALIKHAVSPAPRAIVLFVATLASKHEITESLLQVVLAQTAKPGYAKRLAESTYAFSCVE